MKKLYLLSALVIVIAISPFNNINAQGGVAVNAVGSPPDNSAGFDVNFSNKGELMPRMTAAQRNSIANPATGLTIFNTDCGVYNYNAGTPSSPNWATVNASNALVAAVSISANPVGAICAGTNVTFTATPSSGINSPTYQWQVNGANVGSNSATYADTGLNNGDVVTCILSTSEVCVTGSPATSNSITMTVNPIPATPGSISGGANVCPGTSGNVYSISPVSGATTYNWTVPGDASIASGAGNTSITVTFGSDSGNITVAAVNSCGTSGASQLPITLNPPAPGTPGIISGNTSAVGGSSGNVYSVAPVSTATTYTWTVPSGSFVTSGQGTDSVLVTFGTNSGDISVTAGNSCGTSGASSLVISVCSYSSSSQTFGYTGAQQVFTVPACVFSVTITATGAAGQPSSGGTGGAGGYATGTLTVTPGQTLYVYVGGQGGWNGGGPPGNSGGGYGGDGSDVRMGGAGLNNRIIVAGGGGGSGGESYNGVGSGGAGGGLTGSDGGVATGCGGCDYGGGGGGGTQSAGGAAGLGGCGTCSGACGSAGSLWSGGQGANSDHPYGGGGGGGYYGGGGGGSYCSVGGGGGGSSYIGGVTNGNTTTGGGPATGNGQIVFSW